MGLWDTAGSERYKATSKIYYRGASAAVICYDVIDRDSFHDAKSWIQELRSVEEDCKIYLCATKADLLEIGHEASPSLDMVKRYAASVQFKFFLTSSKTGFNVAELFQEIAQDYMLNPKRIVQPAEDLITLNVHTKRSRCCRS
ncbi:ras-related protein Rab-24 isoform X2 [Orussus abietinus]|nr:ras-related protein Rab-24 isoform X2 [Orussus abietinus]XP_012283715.1 ras-related protein Rab-24 isoform X2 [Orussus abietinus]XP_012283716.1 ras-related protein Rab-24 isoform X2 [Orussus abietinus]